MKQSPSLVRSPASPRRRRRARVLIVDAKPNICLALRRLVGAYHDVETSTDAREVATRIESRARLDLILCDIMMEEMDGPPQPDPKPRIEKPFDVEAIQRLLQFRPESN